MSGICSAQDRVRVQVIYRQAIFQCKDGTEEIVPLSMTGGNTYEHTCKDGKWTNNFVNYSGALSLTQEEYAELKEADLDAKKKTEVEKFIYQKNNPPEYVEPTEEDYKKMIDEKMAEINMYSEKITDATILSDIKTDFESSITSIDSKTEIKEITK
jgi:hypothetical protein